MQPVTEFQEILIKHQHYGEEERVHILVLVVSLPTWPVRAPQSWVLVRFTVPDMCFLLCNDLNPIRKQLVAPLGIFVISIAHRVHSCVGLFLISSSPQWSADDLLVFWDLVSYLVSTGWICFVWVTSIPAAISRHIVCKDWALASSVHSNPRTSTISQTCSLQNSSTVNQNEGVDSVNESTDACAYLQSHDTVWEWRDRPKENFSGRSPHFNISWWELENTMSATGK